MIHQDLYPPPALNMHGNSKNPSPAEGIKLMFTKNIKTLFFPFLLLLLIGLIPLSSFSQGDACIVTPPGAVCGDWIPHTESLNLSSYGEEYGDCEITVVYQSRTCTVINGQCTTRVEQFQLGSIDWNWTDDEEDPCFLFTQFLMPGYPDNFSGIDANNFSAFYGDAMQSLSDLHFMNYFTALPPLQQLALKCSGSSPNCTVPACAPYEAVASKGKCTDFCITPTMSGLSVTLGTCNSIPPVCCTVVTKYCPCFTSSNIFSGFIKSVTVTSNPGACAGNGPLNATCFHGTGGSSFYVPCTAICPPAP